MGNEECKQYFRVMCKNAKIPQSLAIRHVWGKAGGSMYWVKDGAEIRACCIWGARAEWVAQIEP